MQKSIKRYLKNLEEQNVKFKECLNFSTPTRLAIYIKGLPISIKVRSKEIKGPKLSTIKYLQSFVKTHGLREKDLFKKKTDKGEFYFIKTHEKKI